MAAEGGISYAAISKDHNMVEKETMAEYTLRPGVCPIRPSAVLNGRSFYREPVDTGWADISTPLADGHHHCLSRQHELWAVSKPFLLRHSQPYLYCNVVWPQADEEQFYQHL